MQPSSPPQADRVADDAARMARVAAGDETAFQALYAAGYPTAYRAAYGVLLEAAEAREVVQDCFLDLFRLAPRWQARATVGAWLMRTATRKALRRRQRFWRLFSLELPPAWRPPAPDAALRGSEASETLAAGMATLSPKLRAVLTLHLDADLSPAEIAGVLGISPGAARTALHRARARLSAALSSGDQP